MVRISAIFIAVCMVLIAGSIGLVAYLRFGFSGAEAALVGLGVLTALAVYDAVTARLRDRAEASNQLVMLSRSSGDLARQMAEFGRRLNEMDQKVEHVLERSLQTAQPLAEELEELSTLVGQLADSVAAHERALASVGTNGIAAAAPAPATPDMEEAKPVEATPPADAIVAAAPASVPEAAPAPAVTLVPAAPAAPPPPAEPVVAAFAGLDRDAIIALVRDAIETAKLDLYLQPVVTLPQRKVRYYEAMSRLKAGNGDVVAAADFLNFAEAGGLMPKLDHLTVLRCVQVVRRLLLKNRDIGLFCNLASTTLADAGFPQLLEFAEANRAIAPALVFEFSQSAVRAMGPLEHESLAALAARGFRFSMDNVADLRVEPRELNERGFRFIKVPAALLLNRVGAASTDIHPADLSDLLGRFGIDLIAERIEAEGTVVDLLDYDVRFGQGMLFAPPRPVRPEALQGNGQALKDAAKAGGAPQAAAAPLAAMAAAAAPARGGVAELARSGGIGG
ncbi:MAG TPA: EAL domain-containing protein [Xanthobacteraceae bacterium]|nr:EAL domain-containing protein [Xanthobacteraceae bacterium]